MIRFMKSINTAISAYESPMCDVIEVDIQELICTSPFGQTEQYEDGDTGDWFNNL